MTRCRWPSVRRAAALERELDDLHRVEEALVAAAIAAGQLVHRSPRCRPRRYWASGSPTRFRAPVIGPKIAASAGELFVRPHRQVARRPPFPFVGT
jgi:hypothetical protein